MIRLSLVAAAALAALSATACAQSQSSESSTRTNEVVATPMQAAPQVEAAASAEAGVYSDEQLRAFIAASTEIDPISRTLAGATPEQQSQAATQIRDILQRNGLNGETYNAIASQAQADATFAARINALRAPAMPAGAPEAPEPGSPETTTNPQ